MRLVDLVALYLARTETSPRSAQSTSSQVEATPSSPPDRLRRSGTAPELSPLISDWPEEWREVFEERAAIMEFDAGLPRPEAESRAAYWTRRLHRSEGHRGSGHDGDDGHDANA